MGLLQLSLEPFWYCWPTQLLHINLEVSRSVSDSHWGNVANVWQLLLTYKLRYVNPWHACAAKVTALGLSLSLSPSLCVCVGVGVSERRSFNLYVIHDSCASSWFSPQTFANSGWCYITLACLFFRFYSSCMCMHYWLPLQKMSMFNCCQHSLSICLCSQVSCI